jgi:hypothetical protein
MGVILNLVSGRIVFKLLPLLLLSGDPTDLALIVVWASSKILKRGRIVGDPNEASGDGSFDPGRESWETLRYCGSGVDVPGIRTASLLAEVKHDDGIRRG